MNDALIQILTQWGTAGVIAIAAGYLLYDSWKKNKETEKWMREQVQASCTSRGSVQDTLNDLCSDVKEIHKEHQEFREEIRQKVSEIENRMDKHHPHESTEALRLKAVATAAPAVQAIINDGLDGCATDHIAVALLHNGSTSLAGIPYIKFDIVSEKYKPFRCPTDEPLVGRYKNEDIMAHNKLPMCITQNDQAWFEITDECPLKEIDPIIYAKCMKRGIKHLVFESIKDVHGMITGFVVIYNFNGDPNLESLHTTTEAIEKVYHEMLFALS